MKKRLSINKVTLRDLDDASLKGVAGGTVDTCEEQNTCQETCWFSCFPTCLPGENNNQSCAPTCQLPFETCGEGCPPPPPCSSGLPPTGGVQSCAGWGCTQYPDC